MDIKELVKVTEAIIFAKAEPVSAKEISNALKVSTKEAESAINILMEYYSSDDRGIELIKVDNGYQFSTKKECYEGLASFESINNKYHISEAMFEALAIIAYKQPVTRAQVDAIRGVSSANVMSRLLEYGLIYEDDRLDAPGRPFLFKTTDEFLRVFDLESVESLPQIPPDLLEKLNRETQEPGMDVTGEADNNECSAGDNHKDKEPDND